MGSRLMIGLGVVGTVVLMVGGLWFWQGAEELAQEWSRRSVGVWAARSLALALGAAGQVVLLTLVVRGMYFGGRGEPEKRGEPGGRSASRTCGPAWEEAVRLGAALVCAISLVSAVALGLAGR